MFFVFSRVPRVHHIFFVCVFVLLCGGTYLHLNLTNFHHNNLPKPKARNLQPTEAIISHLLYQRSFHKRKKEGNCAPYHNILRFSRVSYRAKQRIIYCVFVLLPFSFVKNEVINGFIIRAHRRRIGIRAIVDYDTTSFEIESVGKNMTLCIEV